MDKEDPIIDRGDHVSTHSKDGGDAYQADEAFQTLRVVDKENLHLDAATSKRLRRRADMLLMPVRRYLYNRYVESVV